MTTTGPTGTILDAHMKAHPRHFWQRSKPPTALELAAAELEECRRDRLEHKGKAEYHDAMWKMLDKREERLVQDLSRLSKPLPQLDGM